MCINIIINDNVCNINIVINVCNVKVILLLLLILMCV